MVGLLGRTSRVSTQTNLSPVCSSFLYVMTNPSFRFRIQQDCETGTSGFVDRGVYSCHVFPFTGGLNSGAQGLQVFLDALSYYLYFLE